MDLWKERAGWFAIGAAIMAGIAALVELCGK